MLSEKEMKKKIKQLLEDEKLRKKMSRKAVEWSAGFGWDESANKFEKVIEGLK